MATGTAICDTNGLIYLNNRYHAPTLGAFISVDPLVGTTGMPYLYANGVPTTLSDPSGLCSRQASMSGRCVGGRLIDADSAFARSKFMKTIGRGEAVERASVGAGYLTSNGWLQLEVARIRRAGATGVGNPEERRYPEVNPTFRDDREAEFVMTLPSADCSGCTTVSVVLGWNDTRIGVVSGDQGKEGRGKAADLAGLACKRAFCDVATMLASWADPGSKPPDFDTTVYVNLKVLQITLDKRESVISAGEMYVTAAVSWTPAQRDHYDEAMFGEWASSGSGNAIEAFLPQAGDVVVSSPSFVAPCGRAC